MRKKQLCRVLLLLKIVTCKELALLRLLGVKRELPVSEEYVVAGEGDIDLRPKQKEDSTFVAEPYFQVFSDRLPFEPNLSILDLLMCEGREAMDGVLLSCQL